MLQVKLGLIAWGVAITVMAFVVGISLVTHNHGFKAVDVNQINHQTNEIESSICLVWEHSEHIILCDTE